MTETSIIRVAIHDGIARLILASPTTRNALSWRFWEELPGVVDRLASDRSVRVIVIEAEGPHFSAGIERGALEKIFAHPEEGEDDGRRRYAFASKVRWLQSGISALESCHLPIIAAVQGACIGAALDLICAADFVFCTSDAWFQIKEIEFGIVADLGVLQRLPRRMARGLVRELAFTGRRFTATEARESGFINGIHNDIDALREAVADTAQHIARHSPLAIVGTKAALNFAENNSVAESLEQAVLWQSAMGLGSDFPVAWAAAGKGAAAHFENLAD